VLQCVADVLQCVAVLGCICLRELHVSCVSRHSQNSTCECVLQVCCSVLQCVAVCCSVRLHLFAEVVR